MNNSQTPSYRNRKKNGKKRLKRTLALFSAGVALTGAGVATLVPQAPWNQSVVQAAEIQHGQQIGSLNGVPVVKANTANMASPEFQALVDSLVADKDLGSVKYVADQIQWNANSEVKGVGGVATGPLGTFFGTNILHPLKQDGFTKDDIGGFLNPGQSLAVTNVGTVTDIETGEKIPVDLIIKHVDVEHGADGWTNKDIAMAIKNQGSVITVGVAVTAGGSISSGSGGISEDGALAGGLPLGIGRPAGYIERIAYTAGLVRQDTKQPIPNEQVLMAMKVSDIDARQLAEVSNQGALAYIVGPNTDLSISGGGLVTGSSTATNNDSRQLLPTAYVVLKQWNSNTVAFSYTDGRREHFDIVTGLFGDMGLKVNADSKGSVTIQKTGTASGSSMWNNLYTLKGNSFRLTDKKTGKTFEGTTDEKGVVTLTDIPFGTYTVEEIKASPGFQKTFKTQEITLDAKTPKATINGKDDQLITVNGTNDEITGKVKITKTGTQSGTTMWNNLYTLKGNKFKLTNKQSGKVYEVTTDDKGQAQIEGMQLGDYTVEEISSSKGFYKTFKTQTATLTQDGTLELTVSGTNDEITGKIKIVKKGTESELAMWNQYYTLLGNKFKLTNKQSGKVYEITTDVKGEALVENMQLGDYTVEEVAASAGFAKTFKAQSALLKQDGTLELTVSGTNDEIKGENTLEKRDKDTDTKAQGQAVLKEAEYTLYYAEDWAGASSHKKDTPVKWTDIPNAKLLKGEKVKTSIINGQEVDNGDNVVLNVDDKDLTVAVGNLALGKYYWKETNAPEGYALDGSIHEFTITKKDDATKNIVTPNTKSLEQIIKAKISIQKIVQSKGDSSHSGINDVTFRATPMDDTKAEAVEFTTTIKEDEDGFATTELLYGDWKIEEVEAPAGYEKIDPIYIHMTYDEKTDLYTITASKNKDGLKPFSTRTFSQSDDQKEKNGNAKGTLAGTLTSSNALISLSRMTFKDNPTPELTPEKPDFQPEKFDLSEGQFDITGNKLMDDDDEVKDEYTDTNKDPYVDKVDNNEPQNLNTKLVKRGDKLFYQLWLDTTKFTPEQLIQATGLIDTYDAKHVTLDIKNIKGYDGKTGDEVTKLFDVEDKDGTLTIQTKKELLKDHVLDTERFAFGRYYKFDIPVTVKDDVPSGTDIENTARQFVTTVNPETGKPNDPTETVEKLTQKRVNKVKKNEPEPHKFVLDKANVDVKGTKLLDDDSELKDRYQDTNKNPYADKVDNNEPENINTAVLKAGTTIHYQVWVDTTPFNKESLLQTIGGEDDYDERYVTIDTKAIKVYNKSTGKDVTNQFDIENKGGKLTVLPNDSVKKTLGQIKVLDTSKFDLGVYYQVEIPATIKKDVPAGVDIENTAKQVIVDKDGKKEEIQTEKRVNKTPKQQPTGWLPRTGEKAGLLYTLLGALLAGLAEGKTRFFSKQMKKALKHVSK
ncbi:SpaA isopeptide-forming pilin-related protein [Streptococcus respiraculi]|uniref:SpaA isopeptide-forming pilin-related protein n=1 Tax=Streptococcus respiraculi TaxID=2021971 RepID=UPI000E7520E7|nr:SpaA isopeptide-forming pilin-related protein [Streptococcus respiraculi]